MSALLEPVIRSMACVDGEDPIENWDHYGRYARVAIALVVEASAQAAEMQDRSGKEWVRDSLWTAILARAGANVRALMWPQDVAWLDQADRHRIALEAIAAGEGIYGQQALEYKNIARAALGLEPL